MDISTLFRELVRLIKKNIIIILFGAVIVAIISIGFNIIIERVLSSEIVEESGENNINDINMANEYLENIYSKNAVSFEFVLIKPDGNVFENSFILDEYFSSDEVIEEIQQNLNFEFIDTLKYEKTLGLSKTSNYRGSIAAIRDRSTNIITMRVLVSDSDEKNLAIAREIESMLASSTIPFLQDIEYVNFTAPQIEEKLPESMEGFVAQKDVITFNAADVDSISRPRNIIKLGLGFIGGAIVTTFLLAIFRLASKYIRYGFEYNVDIDDEQILVNNKKDLEYWVNFPVNMPRNILRQDFETSYTDDAKETVIIVDSDKTSKEWMKKATKKAKVLGKGVKIVHKY